jgi:hypothetical protein
LGSGPTDAQEIMSHAFFRGVDWDDIYHKRVPAPFMPTIKSRADTSNFDSEFTSVTPVLTPVQSGKFLTISFRDAIFDHSIFLLTFCYKSAFPGYARRIPRLLVLGRLCVRSQRVNEGDGHPQRGR